jgi:hypothetical protein
MLQYPQHSNSNHKMQQWKNRRVLSKGSQKYGHSREEALAWNQSRDMSFVRDGYPYNYI